MTRELPNPITKDFLEAEAESVKFTHIVGTLTHCAITVKGGFVFTGESACADPANYDKAKGEEYAHANAISKMWLPYGFLLKHQLMAKEIKAANEKLACDCCEFVSADECPIKPGDYFDFGSAIYLIEQGKKVCRKGWNGKGMFIYYVPAASYPMQRNNLETMGGIFPEDMVPYQAYIALKTAQNDVSTWVPSVSDALAKDWCLA